MAGGQELLDTGATSQAPNGRRVARQFRGSLRRPEAFGAAILVGPYLVLLLVAGIIPTIYAVVQSFQVDGGSGFAGIANYSRIIGDFRFFTTFQHILITLAVWIPIMMVGVVGLALLVHASPGLLGSSMRILYYIPGALAGTANFMLWLFLLNPGQSPLDFLWNGFGFTNLNQVAEPSHLPAILAAMLFFQGAGTWLVIVNGGLNGIPEEVLEAGIVDGAGPIALAWRIKLPIIRPWLGYMLLLNIAYGFQLFVEPQVMSQATHGLISPQWTPNQLSYTYAYQIMNTPAAAAMSVLLLVISLALGLLIVSRSGLFAAQD